MCSLPSRTPLDESVRVRDQQKCKMAAAFCRSGQISPTNFTRPLEKVFDDAQHTGHINLIGRKLKEFPKLADKYDLTDTSAAGKLNDYSDLVIAIATPFPSLAGSSIESLAR